MDALEDKDVLLHRASSDLIAELQTSLPKFLFKKDTTGPSIPRVRRAVRYSATVDLIRLLEPFQEWPQLLDPHLTVLLPPLVAAFLQYVEQDVTQYFIYRESIAPFAQPLPRAVSQLLYTLCKVRGSKVISRFLTNEPRYLEILLNAFQLWNGTITPKKNVPPNAYTIMVWQEKYIMMLWLSHLMLTPFDLTFMTSIARTEAERLPPTLSLPEMLPPLATRIISVCTTYIGSAGKEREAAVTLLVRLILRPDMRQLKLHDALISWALSTLEDGQHTSSQPSVYGAIGILSFLASTVVSADAAVIQPFLSPIMKSIRRLNIQSTSIAKEVISSALARKYFVKIFRAISITSITLNSSDTDSVLEEVIDYLLTTLADKDAPVRQAASKALSLITVKLDASMAADIVEAVVGSLEENVLWVDVPTGIVVPNYDHDTLEHLTKERDLTAVNPLRWQGLVLTLSHLLFRRSPPPAQLSSILNSLLLALAFEQRSSAGHSIGTSIRDAACFGIWSLARRYTTKEILAVNVSTVRVVQNNLESITMLQTLANALTVAASLDPSGNIRRGASAALQELVGRHPDTIHHGISLVQIVDYHAVALRSKAFKEVAIAAARLADSYWNALLVDLLGWRGIAAQDAESRRTAAETVGLLASLRGKDGISEASQRLWSNFHRLQEREVEQKHGQVLAAVALTKAAHNLYRESSNTEALLVVSRFWGLFTPGVLYTEQGFTSNYLRPELTAEAACSLIAALASIGHTGPGDTGTLSVEVLNACMRYVDLSLSRSEEIAIISASAAAKSLLQMIDSNRRSQLVSQWIEKLSLHQTDQHGRGSILGYLSALGAIYPSFSDDESMQARVHDSIVASIQPSANIDTKVAALRSLSEGLLPCRGLRSLVFYGICADELVMTSAMIAAINNGLCDYTTDQRGDIGSLVRVQAVATVRTAWRYGLLTGSNEQQPLLAAVCGLAAERLDRVRFQACLCLQDIWSLYGVGDSDTLQRCSDTAQASTSEYFAQLLRLYSVRWARGTLLSGFVTSAGGGGAESLLCAARSALAKYVFDLEPAQRGQLVNECSTLLLQHARQDRIVLAALDTLAYLLETGLLRALPDGSLPWKSILARVQQAHFKSTSIPKLLAAVNVYAGCASLSTGPLPTDSSSRLSIDAEASQAAQTRLASLLLHRFAKVRNAAADALFVAWSEAGVDATLERTNWARPPAQLRTRVVALQAQIEANIEASSNRG